MKKRIILFGLLFFLIDQISKFFVIKYLDFLTVIPNFLSLTFVKNTGVAFSMLSGNWLFIILLSLVIICFLIYFVKKEYLMSKKNNIFYDIVYALVFGGVFGNLIDRIYRGFVVDFISVHFLNYYFPVFNLADIFITFGTIFLIFITFKEDKKQLK